MTAIKRTIDDRRAYREGYAPLLPHHTRRSTQDKVDRPQDDSSSDESDAPSLNFDDEGPNDSWEESMYSRARKVQYFGYPNVDVSKEKAKRKQWEEEEGVLANKWSTRQGRKAVNGKSRRDGKGKGKAGAKLDKKPGVYGKCESTYPSRSSITDLRMQGRRMVKALRQSELQAPLHNLPVDFPTSRSTRLGTKQRKAGCMTERMNAPMRGDRRKRYKMQYPMRSSGQVSEGSRTHCQRSRTT